MKLKQKTRYQFDTAANVLLRSKKNTRIHYFKISPTSAPQINHATTHLRKAPPRTIRRPSTAFPLKISDDNTLQRTCRLQQLKPLSILQKCFPHASKMHNFGAPKNICSGTQKTSEDGPQKTSQFWPPNATSLAPKICAMIP